jgi:hypothetical protein
MRMPTLMNRVMQAVSSRFGIGGNIQGYLPWTLTGYRQENILERRFLPFQLAIENL